MPLSNADAWLDIDISCGLRFSQYTEPVAPSASVLTLESGDSLTMESGDTITTE